MLTKHEPVPTAGLSYTDVEVLSKSTIAIYNVAAETNKNIKSSQKQLLLWHWILGHANFQWIQMLAAQPHDKNISPIILTKQSNVSSCHIPLCMACQMAKQSRRTPDGTSHISDPTKEMLTKRDHLIPGQAVSVDQYMGSIPGRLPNTKGKEKEKDQYTGGTIFVDHASSFIFVRNQFSLRAGETIVSKRAFETLAKSNGVEIQSYFGDNVPFNSAEFQQDLVSKGQAIVLSGVGAHHQNGVAERAIRTVTSFARAAMMHMVTHWPEQANLMLWPFAMEYSVFVWNHLPNRISRLAPIEIFSRTRQSTSTVLQRCRVWGCPVYVLAPELQDGKKIPKWHPRTRRGMFLGFSSAHSSTVGKILNLVTGHISPQYQLVYDELFTTVSTDKMH
jgi:hypothetical protein